MQRPFAARPAPVACVALVAVIGAAAAAQPAEVSGVTVSASSQVAWTPAAGSDDYNVYRGLLAWLRSGNGAECHGDEIAATTYQSPTDPPIGQGYFYWVTAESNADGEGTVGTASGGGARPLRGSCDQVVRHHILDRTGYGADEWSRSRFTALGVQGYLDEQMNPATVDEASNTELAARRAALVPPDTLDEMQALDIVNAVYARRQLEQQATLFWDNHFNTDYTMIFGFFGFYQTLFPATRTIESTRLHYEAQNGFRDLAFSGRFRDIVESSGLGPAMIIYLDTESNVVGDSNENYARELLELHTMGVDGGYVQADVVQLAKVFTGWNVCKKPVAEAHDPLSACIPRTLYGSASEPAGVWVSNFRPTHHDPSQKVLFAGTPHQAIIPSTAGNPVDGINDAGLAFDAILAHPSTPRHMARKILQRFVDENPTQTMIDAVVAEWNDAGNPQGIGDLREVLRSALQQAAFRDPDRIGAKIKTPFEHLVSALRAVRGRTDGLTEVRNYQSRMQEAFHANPVPTGYSEIGGEWLDTNNLLERRNFGFDMATRTASSFGADVIGLLNAGGVSTAATPNNAPAIVDFLSDVMFGGALTAAERQRGIAYLNTDDNGVATNYNDARIRETAGFLLAHAQFLEQ